MTGKKFAYISMVLTIMTLFLGLSVNVVVAAEPEFELSIDNQNLQKGVSANLDLTIKNAKDAQVTGINGLENFDVLTSNQSYSTQIVNFAVTTQTNVHYSIMPKNSGQFKLQGNIQYQGKTYQTNEIKVNVDQAAAVGGANNKKEDTFVKTTILNTQLYFGQKVALVYELFTRFNISSFGILEKLNFDGFIVNEIPQDKLYSNIVDLDGEKYARYEAKKAFLTSVKSGEFDIPSYNMQVNIPTGDFFGTARTTYVQTEAKKLIVKPLPQDNKPADFSGIVGKLNINAEYNLQKMNIGDSLTLHVKASGNCNLEGLRKIFKGSVPGFSVYETEKNLEENIENGQYKAQKEFDVILVPQKNGEIKIPPQYISYFNPETGTYEKAEIPGNTVTISGDALQSPSTGQIGQPALQTVKIDQVSYDPVNDQYFTIKLKKSNAIIISVVLLILAVILLAAVFIVKPMMLKDRELKQMLRRLNKTDDPTEMYDILNNMIKFKFNLSIKAIPKNEVANRLDDSRLVTSVLEIIDHMENKRPGIIKGDSELKNKIKEIFKMLVKP